MKVLVNEMPRKREECLFNRREYYYDRLMKEYCGITGKTCTLKNENSVLGGECRCLRVGVNKIRIL